METVANNKTDFSQLPVYELKSQEDWKIAFLELAFPNICKGFHITQTLDDKRRSLDFALTEIKANELHKIYAFLRGDDFGRYLALNPFPIVDHGNIDGHGTLSIFTSEIMEKTRTITDHFLTLDDPFPLSPWTLRKIVSDVISKRFSPESFNEEEALENAIKALAILVLIQEMPEQDFSSYDQEAFFDALEKQSQRIKDQQVTSEPCLLLSDLPPEKLDSWEDFRQALQECAFGRTKALQYFKDYELPDKQAALIKRTDKRLFEIFGDKNKWQRKFEQSTNEVWTLQVQLEDNIKRIERRLEADFGHTLYGGSLFQGLLAMGVENHNRAKHLPELSGLNRDDILLKLADLRRVQHSSKPDVLAQNIVEAFDKDYLKLKHSLEDIYYGKCTAPEDSASLRSRVGYLLAAYIITCYPEFPEHLPSKENSAHKLKHYDPEYNLQCIEKRLGLHVVPGLLSHQQRYKQILMTLKAPSEAYNLTEDEQWSYIVNEVDRQYPLKGSTNEDYKPHPRENTSDTLDFTNKQLTPQERQKILGLHNSGTKNRQVLEQFCLYFRECVSYENLQTLIWKRPSKNISRPYNNAEKACSAIQKDLEPLGFLLEEHVVNKKTIGRKMLRKGTL